MTFDVLKLLEQEGYIKEGDDNLVHAEKAFFAARVMNWIREKVQSDPDFDLQSYLTMLYYYKMDLADLKFTDDGSILSYRMKDNGKEMQELVNSLIKSTRKSSEEPAAEATTVADSTEDADRTPDL